MRGILGLFGKSPFGALQNHMEKVKECVDLIEPMMEALFAEDFDEVKRIAKEVMKLEHNADEVKNSIRDHLPKSLFLPVDRRDLLVLLSAQDDVADYVEDLGVIVTLRHTRVPEALREPTGDFVGSVLRVYGKSAELVDQLDELLQASFGGPESEKVMHMIEELEKLEWEADKRQYKVAQELYTQEGKISNLDIMVLVQALQKLGQIANSAESIGKQVRLFISQ